MALSSEEMPGLSPTVLRGLDLGRELGTRTVLFHQAVAERVGLNATDFRCLDLAQQAGVPLTAGQLADITGLTTGAITGVIDHLERAGLARRVRDPQDRRKVLVEPILAPMQHVIPIFHDLGRAMAAVCMRYDEGQLRVIYGFLEQAIAVMMEQTERLRDRAAPRESRPEPSAP